MATYDRNNPMNQQVQNSGFFSKLLRLLSGMDYNNMISKQSHFISIHEDPMSVTQGTNMYDIFTKKVIARLLDKKSIAYLDRTYIDKRKILRQYSIKDEIKDFLTILADECIIYDENQRFCTVKDLPDDFDDTVRKKYLDNFETIYNNFKFNDGITAWNYLKTLLMDGYITFEIVYDSKQKNIKEIVQIDPMSLVPATDPINQTLVWVQFPDNPQLRRIIPDSNVVYISYSNNYEFAETSYIESLIRPYNQLKMLEQTKLLYNINQAAIWKKFIIPVNGLTRTQAEQQIYQLMSEYHEDVQFDDNTGIYTINGSTTIPHSKDFWFPQSEAGTPTVEIMPPGQIDLNEDTMVKWFYKALKRASKIPFSRFDDTEGGGGNFSNDASEMTRDEIRFSNFIRRIRQLFKEILIKPLRIQTILDFPELREDPIFNSSIKLEYNSNDLFEEWKRLRNLAKRAEIAGNVTGLQGSDQQPFFHMEWVARNILHLSEKELAENAKFKTQSAPGGETGGMPEMGGGMPEMGGGMPEMGGGVQANPTEMGGGAQANPTEMGGGAQANPTEMGGGAQATPPV